MYCKSLLEVVVWNFESTRSYFLDAYRGLSAYLHFGDWVFMPLAQHVTAVLCGCSACMSTHRLNVHLGTRDARPITFHNSRTHRLIEVPCWYRITRPSSRAFWPELPEEGLSWCSTFVTVRIMKREKCQDLFDAESESPYDIQESEESVVAPLAEHHSWVRTPFDPSWRPCTDYLGIPTLRPSFTIWHSPTFFYMASSWIACVHWENT